MPKKILLADDSITIQKVIGLTFANEDVVLTVVDNGDEALIKAREVTPDLIIADVVMPGKDGYEVCYSIKHDPNLAHVPVLLLTGTFETFDETMATKVGANGFITKPFESQALIDKVNELIGQAQASVKAPSINDLLAEPASLDAGLPAADLGAGLDGLDPVEPLEDIAPMELEEVQPLEDNPLEKFASLEPDPEEASFADVSFDEPAPATLDTFDDLAPAEPEPEPEPMPAAPPVQAAPPPPPPPAPAPAATIAPPPPPPAPAATIAPPPPAPVASVAPSAPVAPVAPSAPAASAGETGGWNMTEFGDYMSDQTAVSGLPADDEPTEIIDMTEPAPLEPAAEAYELGAAEPAAEELGSPDAFEMTAETPAAHELSAGDAFDLTAETPAAQELSAGDAFDLAAETPAAHELSAGDGFDLAAETPAAHELSAGDAFDVAAETPAAQEFSARDAFDLSAETSAEPAASGYDLSAASGDAFGAEEVALPEPAHEVPLESVADMYPLDETPAPAPAAAEPVRPASVDISSFDEPLHTESLAATIGYEPPPPPPPAPVAAPAGLDAEALERELGRIPELVETRVRAALETDLMSQVGDRTAKVIEGQIEEAIRKVAPSLIQQLVDKAIADATERILNETIGRLRK